MRKLIEVLRIGNRIARDKRISTHVALTARAFSADKIYYSGQKDSEMENSVNKITEKFGGKFEVKYISNYTKLINEKKENKYLIVHLTMYGIPFEKKIKNLKNKNLLIIIGGEKVPGEIYKLSDYNLSVSLQPISEVSGLGILLYNLNGEAKFSDSKAYIEPSERGKVLKTRKE